MSKDTRINGHHLYFAVLGHTLEVAGRHDKAATEFARSAPRTSSAPERDALLYDEPPNPPGAQRKTVCSFVQRTTPVGLRSASFCGVSKHWNAALAGDDPPQGVRDCGGGVDVYATQHRVSDTNRFFALERLAMSEYTAEVSTTIAATTKQVWAALIDPNAIEKYFMGATVKTDWKVGSSITWSGEWKGKPFQDKGKILVYEPEKQVSYSHWSPLGGTDDQPENYHAVTMTLHAAGSSTRVDLTQSNLDGKVTETDRKGRAEYEKNWSGMLESLKGVVEDAAFDVGTKSGAATSSGPAGRSTEMEAERMIASKTFEAVPDAVFSVLADPSAHADIDGTGWVRESLDRDRLTATGQIFRMAMYHEGHPDKDYKMANQVEVYDEPKAIAWKPGQESLETGKISFGGWIWRYDLEADGPTRTTVTLTYDWSAVPPQVREDIHFPPFGQDHLDNSLQHLSDLVGARS